MHFQRGSECVIEKSIKIMIQLNVIDKIGITLSDVLIKLIIANNIENIANNIIVM
jgi:hypothetical protein